MIGFRRTLLLLLTKLSCIHLRRYVYERSAEKQESKRAAQGTIISHIQSSLLIVLTQTIYEVTCYSVKAEYSPAAVQMCGDQIYPRIQARRVSRTGIFN